MRISHRPVTSGTNRRHPDQVPACSVVTPATTKPTPESTVASPKVAPTALGPGASSVWSANGMGDGQQRGAHQGKRASRGSRPSRTDELSGGARSVL